MILNIPFEVPYKRCERCLAFDPAVTRSDYEIDRNYSVKCKTEYRCKGERFCLLRGELESENE